MKTLAWCNFTFKIISSFDVHLQIYRKCNWTILNR